jgi:type IX secretion system PorP/SprF family membrane protein
MTPQFLMMRHLLFWVLASFLPGILSAQQTPFISFANNNWISENPASLDQSYLFDSRNSRNILHILARNQWVGVTGSPQYYHAAFTQNPKGNYLPVKWGVQAVHQSTDAISTTGIFGNFSYILNFTESLNQRLSIGINGGMIRYSLNVSDVQFQDADDPVAVNQNQYYADFSFGLFYYAVDRFNKKGFYLGVSVPQTFGLSLFSGSGLLSPERKMHLYLNTGGFIPMNHQSFREYDMIEISLHARYLPGVSYFTIVDDLPVNAAVQMKYYLGNIAWGGVGFGTNGVLELTTGFGQIPVRLSHHGNELKTSRLRIGFSIGLPVLSNVNSLGFSLEMMGAYIFN